MLDQENLWLQAWYGNGKHVFVSYSCELKKARYLADPSHAKLKLLQIHTFSKHPLFNYIARNNFAATMNVFFNTHENEFSPTSPKSEQCIRWDW